MPDWAFHWIGYTLAAVAAILIAWSFFADRARGRVRCRKCWYDLAGLNTLPATCPECGKSHTKPKHLKRTRRRKRWAVVGVLVLVASYGAWTTPRVVERGWVGAVPTTAMVVAAPWINKNWSRSHQVSTQLHDELRDRLYEGQPAILMWPTGKYWSLAGVQNVWPMSTADISSPAREKDVVADYLFVPFLGHGYGSRADQIEYVKRSLFRGHGLSLDGRSIYDAGRNIVGVNIDSVSKAPGNRWFVVYLGPSNQSRYSVSKPPQPYSQSFPQKGIRSLFIKSPEIILWLNSDDICSSLIWIESARGADLGCYRVEWSLDPNYLEEGGTYVFLDIERWGIVSD